MKRQTLLGRFLIWRVKHIGHRQFVLILSVIVGLASGFGAIIIKNSVHFIQHLLTGGFSKDLHLYLYFIYPIIGILITVLIIKFVIRQSVGHGIPSTLFAISKKNSIMRRHNLFSSIITSTFTVGFGGSAGLEGPTVATGASFGSYIGQLLRLNYKTTTLLLGCGAAGAMSGIFNAPIAAIVFALEVIMLDLTMASLVPLLVASTTAALTTWLLMGNLTLLSISLKDPFILTDVPFFILLGILTGLVSVYFSKMFWFVEEKFSKTENPYRKLIIGGLLLGTIVFLIPPLYGEGYTTVNNLLSGNYADIFNNSIVYKYRVNDYYILVLLTVMLLLKVAATSITFGAGGIGGIFAPTLFMGATAGFIFSKSFNIFGLTNIFGFPPLSETNFTLVGMCGMIAGVLHAPLTAIFLIAEITGGYELFMPLMITGTIAYITARYFNPHSVYTMQLAKRGELITHHKDKAVLTLMKLNTEVEKDFATIPPETSLGDIIKVVAKSKRNIFPVVDKDKMLLGIVLLDDIREIMFKPELYSEVYVESLMTMPPTYVSSKDSMDAVMKKFKDTGAWNLPVIDQGKYVGFVSKSKLFNAYRKLLLAFSEE